MSDQLEPQPQSESDQVLVFIDYWNLMIGLKETLGEAFHLDWQAFGNFLIETAKPVLLSNGLTNPVCKGSRVYASYGKGQKGNELRQWLSTKLARMASITVHSKERVPKGAPECPDCNRKISTCPKCRKPMIMNQEKGIDAAIITDMLSMAWEGHYSAAILVSADRDFIPAVTYLRNKKMKVFQGTLPNKGDLLANACTGRFTFRPNDLPGSWEKDL